MPESDKNSRIKRANRSREKHNKSVVKHDKNKITRYLISKTSKNIDKVNTEAVPRREKVDSKVDESIKSMAIEDWI